MLHKVLCLLHNAFSPAIQPISIVIAPAAIFSGIIGIIRTHANATFQSLTRSLLSTSLSRTREYPHALSPLTVVESIRPRLRAMLSHEREALSHELERRHRRESLRSSRVESASVLRTRTMSATVPMPPQTARSDVGCAPNVVVRKPYSDSNAAHTRAEGRRCVAVCFFSCLRRTDRK